MDPIPPAPPEPAEPVTPEAAPEAPGFSLTPEQLLQAGIVDPLQVGDSFSVTINGTVVDNANGITADIDSVTGGMKADPAIDGEPEGDEPPLPEPPPVRPRSRVIGPDEAGFNA